MTEVPDPSAYWVTRSEAAAIMGVLSPNVDKAARRHNISTRVSYNSFRVYLREDVERAAVAIAAMRAQGANWPYARASLECGQ